MMISVEIDTSDCSRQGTGTTRSSCYAVARTKLNVTHAAEKMVAVQTAGFPADRFYKQ
jgi:hypothetical protein